MIVKNFTSLGFRSCINKTSRRISKQYSRYVCKERGDYLLRIYTKKNENKNTVTIEFKPKEGELLSYTIESATMPKIEEKFKTEFNLNLRDLPLYLKEYEQY